MRKCKSMYPAPVYEAHFADGTVRRMSFYQVAGKPWDFERGAANCRNAGRGLTRAYYFESRANRLWLEGWAHNVEAFQGETVRRLGGLIDGPEHPPIVDGYIFHGDKDPELPFRVVRDPRFDDSPPFYACAESADTPKAKAKPRQTVLQYRRILERILQCDETAIREARDLLAAA